MPSECLELPIALVPFSLSYAKGDTNAEDKHDTVYLIPLDSPPHRAPIKLTL
jgi:hypothetical protein